VLLLAAMRGRSDAWTLGVPDVSSSMKNSPGEIYASGGG